jgi:hypothetical protein
LGKRFGYEFRVYVSGKNAHVTGIAPRLPDALPGQLAVPQRFRLGAVQKHG